jgi:hypothetical protein
VYDGANGMSAGGWAGQGGKGGGRAGQGGQGGQGGGKGGKGGKGGGWGASRVVDEWCDENYIHGRSMKVLSTRSYCTHTVLIPYFTHTVLYSYCTGR